ncbi:MAG: YIP1 family protein [Candidatus Promineifilaceae bacterium]
MPNARFFWDIIANPRTAAKTIVASEEDWLAYLFASCLGVLFILVNDIAPPILIRSQILWGIILGLGFSLFGGFAFWFVGARLQGTGTPRDVRVVLSWLCAGPLSINFAEAVINLWANQLTSTFDSETALWVLGVFVVSWGSYVMCTGISEAHQFSLRKGYLTYLLGGIFLIAAILATIFPLRFI